MKTNGGKTKVVRVHNPAPALMMVNGGKSMSKKVTRNPRRRNPARRKKNAMLATVRRKRNPGYRRNPALAPSIKDALVGGAAAIAAEAVSEMANQFLHLTGWGRVALKVAAGVGVGFAVGKFASAEYARAAQTGALIPTAIELVNQLIPGLSQFGSPSAVNVQAPQLAPAPAAAAADAKRRQLAGIRRGYRDIVDISPMVNDPYYGTTRGFGDITMRQMESGG